MFKQSHFSQFLRVVTFENTPTNKDMFKVDDTRATSVNVIQVSFDWLVKYFLKSVMETVLVKIEVFTMNGSNGVYDGACFYLHDVVVCFQ